MRKIKLFLIIIFFFNFNNQVFGDLIEIKVKIDDNIITNFDIENEKKYLFFLNPKLQELSNPRMQDIAIDSLITDIIKKKELEKYFDFSKNEKIIDIVEKNLLLKKNIKNRENFKKILQNLGLDYEIIKQKFFIEALWNQLVYEKYSANVVINKNQLKQKIQKQISKERKKFSYNLSEIFFEESFEESLDYKISKINESIENIGFENTANIFSSANTSNKGGLIGWVNELQLSSKIINEIDKLNINEISKPIKLQKGYILIKINDKREVKQKINLDEQLKKFINNETNRQLNSFSTIFYKRLRKNIEINEY